MATNNSIFPLKITVLATLINKGQKYSLVFYKLFRSTPIQLL